MKTQTETVQVETVIYQVGDTLPYHVATDAQFYLATSTPNVMSDVESDAAAVFECAVVEQCQNHLGSSPEWAEDQLEDGTFVWSHNGSYVEVNFEGTLVPSESPLLPWPTDDETADLEWHASPDNTVQLEYDQPTHGTGRHSYRASWWGNDLPDLEERLERLEGEAHDVVREMCEAIAEHMNTWSEEFETYTWFIDAFQANEVETNYEIHCSNGHVWVVWNDFAETDQSSSLVV